MQIQIRLLLIEQSDLDQHCLSRNSFLNAWRNYGTMFIYERSKNYTRPRNEPIRISVINHDDYVICLRDSYLPLLKAADK